MPNNKPLMTINGCIGVDFKIGFLDCVRNNRDLNIPGFVLPMFCAIHFTVTLARLNDIVVIPGASFYQDYYILVIIKD